MHAVYLSELAILFIRHAATQLANRQVPSREQANSYWLASRFRHEDWSGRLAQHRVAIQRPGAFHRAQSWKTVLPTMQEVLLAEPLTRCLAYYARLLEAAARNEPSDFSSLAETTLQSHVEARNRCLHLIVFGQGLPVEHSISLNRLRRHMEGLSDQLIACLPSHCERDKYCFDGLETQDLHDQLGNGKMTSSGLRLYSTALMRQLWQATENSLEKRGTAMRLNDRIGQSVLSMWGGDLFDSFGVPMSREFTRLKRMGSDSDGKVGDAPRPMQEPLNTLVMPESSRLKQVQRRW